MEKETKDKKGITKDMPIGDAVQKYPEVIPIFLEAGMHCVGCHVAAFETIEQGCMAHGMDEKAIKELIEKVNKKISEK